MDEVGKDCYALLDDWEDLEDSLVRDDILSYYL
jgi:hypothetical protein